MAKAFESIMRGLKEIEAHKNGSVKLTSTVIETGPCFCSGLKVVKTREPKAEKGATLLDVKFAHFRPT